MRKAALLAILSALNVRHTARSIMARAQRVLRATTTRRRSKILLRVITFTQGMNNSFSTQKRTRADGLARDQIQLLQNNNMGANTRTTARQTTLRNRDLKLLQLYLASLASRLFGDERLRFSSSIISLTFI